MKTTRRILALGLLAAALAMGQGGKCVIDDLPLIRTGRSQTVSGVLVFEYKCVRGHVYWERQ